MLKKLTVDHGITLVPMYLVEDPELSATALGVIAFLCYAIPHNLPLSVSTITSRFGMKERKWRHVSAELRAKGILSSKRTNKGIELMFTI